jgi:glycerol kinase
MSKKSENLSSILVITCLYNQVSATLFDRHGRPIYETYQTLEWTSVFQDSHGFDPHHLSYAIRSCVMQLQKAFPDSLKALNGTVLITPPNWALAWDKVSGKALSPVITDLAKPKQPVWEKKKEDVPHPQSAALKWAFLKKQNLSYCMFGQVSDWLRFQFTHTKPFYTTVGFAAKTMLMNFSTLMWDDFLVREYKLHPDDLPLIDASAKVVGLIQGFPPIPDGTPLLAVSTDIESVGLGLGLWHFGDCALIHKPDDGIDIFLSHLGTQTLPQSLSTYSPVFPPHSTSLKPRKQIELHWAFPWDLLHFFPVIHASFGDSSDGIKMVQEKQKFGFIGLEKRHRPSHVCRAYFEGFACLTQKWLSEFSAETGISPKSLQLVGPFSKRLEYAQLLSDILQIPVHYFSTLPISQGGFFLGRHILHLDSKQSEYHQPPKGDYVFHPMLDPHSSHAFIHQWRKR